MRGFLISSTMAAQCTGDWPVAARLHSAHREQVQSSLVDETVLVEGQECTRVCEVGGVWVE